MKKKIERVTLYAKPYRFWIILCVIVCLFNSAISIVIGDYIRSMIDLVVEKQEHATTFMIRAGILIVTAGVVITYLQTYCSSYLGVYIIRDFRKKIADKIQTLSVKTIEENHTGEIVSKINYDLPVIQSFFTEILPMMIYYPFVLAGTVTYLAIIDWKLLLITICLVPITIFLSSKMGIPVRKYARAVSESAAKEVATAKDIISGIYTSKAFNLQDTVFKKYEKSANELIKNHYLYEKMLAVLTPFDMIIMLVPFLFCFAFGGYFAVRGWITTGSLYAFIFLLNNLVDPMSEIPTFINEWRTFTASLDRVEQLLQIPEERTGGDTDIDEGSMAIEFRNVHFSYDNENKIHKGLSLKIPRGKFAALVGTSGCGKTTVFKQICGFNRPQEGSVYIYDKDVEEWDLEALRDQLALISQDTFLFPATIMENISYGNPQASLEEIYDAAKAANAHEFIMKLPNGYETMTGERGIKLSGGQKQRISIARAILKDAKILLMDEPTASLDAQSEALIEKAAWANKGRTCFLIAHRLSTIKNADIIYVMDKGRIVEEGTYHELMEKDGLLKRLYMSQYSDTSDSL